MLSWCLRAVCPPVRHEDLYALSFSLGENLNAASGNTGWQRKLAFILAVFRQMCKCLE